MIANRKLALFRSGMNDAKAMKLHLPVIIAFTAVLALACEKPAGAEKPTPAPPTPKPAQTLAQARSGFATRILKEVHAGEPVDPPPAGLFTLVHYPSPAGNLAAYISRVPDEQEKHPAIIWLVGGFSSSIGSIAWTPGKPTNDQSGSTFWRSGIVTMYPSYRGGNDNPGHVENFFGEVDDVLAAAEFLAKTPGIDPQRIYLGGHSTGGTLTLLIAEVSPRFRAVFSLGPVGDVTGYGDDVLVFDKTNKREGALRAPIRWMQGISSPTFVFEGADGRSNISSLRALAKAPHSAAIHFHPVKGADHFSAIQRLSRFIAAKILADKNPAAPISVSPEEIDAAR
jgi:acetyl esterase/lipase